MNGKNLLEKMELIDPAFIEEADKMPAKKPGIIMKRLNAALAASIVIMTVSGAVMLSSDDIVFQADSLLYSGSIFSGGTVSAVIFGVSLLAAAGIAALIVKEKKSR